MYIFPRQEFLFASLNLRFQRCTPIMETIKITLPQYICNQGYCMTFFSLALRMENFIADTKQVLRTFMTENKWRKILFQSFRNAYTWTWGTCLQKVWHRNLDAFQTILGRGKFYWIFMLPLIFQQQI